MLSAEHMLSAPWQGAESVRCLFTSRTGGVSNGVFGGQYGVDGLNFGQNVGDSPDAVSTNRALLSDFVAMQIAWLRQVHGTKVLTVDPSYRVIQQADAMVCAQKGIALAVQSADCLPVLFADAHAGVVGIAHAGWRGLAAGVLENTLRSMDRLGASIARVQVCFGPAIGPLAFEVGDDVLSAFALHDAASVAYFKASTTQANKWYADLTGLATMRLRSAGVQQIDGSHRCTLSDKSHCYSYRRDGRTGRSASLIWLV